MTVKAIYYFSVSFTAVTALFDYSGKLSGICLAVVGAFTLDHYAYHRLGA